MDTCAETNDVAFSEFSSVFLWVRKTPFWCHFILQAEIYQDRLGTNTRAKTHKKRGVFSRQVCGVFGSLFAFKSMKAKKEVRTVPTHIETHAHIIR